jgi:hypothetical protein
VRPVRFTNVAAAGLGGCGRGRSAVTVGCNDGWGATRTLILLDAIERAKVSYVCRPGAVLTYVRMGKVSERFTVPSFPGCQGAVADSK